MYCIKCGFKNKGEAIFCANCGSVMTEKPTDAFDHKIQSEEKNNGTEKNIADENRESGIEDISSAEQPSKENSSGVSLAKPEAVQSVEMNQIRIKRFSVPRFIFSLIIILAAFCSVATIAFKYVGLTLTMEIDMYDYNNSDTDYLNVKGYKIIKNKDYLNSTKFVDSLEEMGGDVDEYVDTRNMFRYIIIAFMVAILVFCIIDFVLLCLVRNRIAYIFTMIFVFVKAALGGIAIYIWTADMLDQFKKAYALFLRDTIDLGSYRILIECGPGIGLILAMVMQAVILISAVVLLCIRPKYQDVAPQTICA